MDRDEAIRLFVIHGPAGVEEWNHRRAAGEEVPNFLGANLTGCRLEGANLAGLEFPGADFSGSKLARASLAGSNLAGADLYGCDLSHANLLRADLFEARLERADLSGASLVEVDLSGANLGGTRLAGANLTGARVNGTAFDAVDLSEVVGLATLQHDGPSSIGLDTLLLSRGTIPEPFLRGAGVPREWVERVPSLVGALKPDQYASCFISYSFQDQAFADKLHQRMIQEGLRVWFAPRDMRGGRKIHEQVDQAIVAYDRLLLVLSQASMNSDWVQTEIHNARLAEKREKRRKLFPIRLVDFETIRSWTCFDADIGKDSAVEIREYYIPDFSRWRDNAAFEAEFARLLLSLKESP